MALNPKLVTSLAKRADDAADAFKFVSNFGDDAARLASKYGDDILSIPPRSESLPFGLSNSQITERSKNAALKRLQNKNIPSTRDTKSGDTLSELFDVLTGDDYDLNRVPDVLLDTPYTDKFGNAVNIASGIPGLNSYRDNPQMQIIKDRANRAIAPHSWALHTDNELGRTFPVRIDRSFDNVLENVDNPIPFEAYKWSDAPSTSITDAYGSRNVRGFEPDVPLHKGTYQAYDPRFEDSPYFPDGFASPDDFARYYDSLELGYTPIEWSYDSLNEAFSDVVDTDDWNDFWDAHYGYGKYADEGPLEAFFSEQRKLPRGFTRQPPNRRIEEFFSNPMFQDDYWIK